MAKLRQAFTGNPNGQYFYYESRLLRDVLVVEQGSCALHFCSLQMFQRLLSHVPLQCTSPSLKKFQQLYGSWRRRTQLVVYAFDLIAWV